MFLISPHQAYSSVVDLLNNSIQSFLLSSFYSILSIPPEALHCSSRQVSFHLVKFLFYSFYVQPECCLNSFVLFLFYLVLTGVISESILFHERLTLVISAIPLFCMSALNSVLLLACRSAINSPYSFEVEFCISSFFSVIQSLPFVAGYHLMILRCYL